MPAKTYVQTTINGEHVDFLCEPRQSLLECLRDVIGLTGSKEGCNDGNCGACTVMLDGRIVTSCLVLGVEAEGKEITTIVPRGAAPRSDGLPGECGTAVRHLHARLHRRIEGAAGPEPQPHRARDTLLACQQPVPLHGLRQDRSRRAGRGGEDAGGLE